MKPHMLGPVLATLLAALGTSIANIALPQMATGLQAPIPQVQWVVIGYLLSLTVFSAGAGRWGDQIGHTRALRFGVALFAAGACAAALSPHIAMLVAARMVQGLGAAVMVVMPMAVLRGQTAPHGLGRAMGALGSASAMGTAMGPAVGGFLVAGFGWRAVFWLMAGLALLCLPLLTGKTEPRTLPRAADHAGALTLTVAVAALALAPTLGHGVTGVALLAVSAAAFWMFWRVEGRAADPFFPPATLADPMLRRAFVANALVAAVMMTTLIVGPFYLAQGLHLGPGSVGLVMSLGPILSAASGIPAGRLVDRFGAPRLAVLGVLQMALAVTVIAALVQWGGLWAYLAGIALLTPGYQMFLAANTTAVMARATPDQRGLLSGFLGLSRNLGLILGAAAIGALFAGLAQGNHTASATAVTFAATAALLISAASLIKS